MYIKDIINIAGVFITYFILIIMITSFMIKPIIRKERIFNRFVIALIIGNFYIINVVFALSYLKMFNRITLIVTLLVTSIYIRIILDKQDAIKIFKESKDTIKRLIDGEFGIKLFIHRKILGIRFKIKHLTTELFKGNVLEWLIFLFIMGYNVYYYSYNSIHFVSYGAPDEEVHLYWIQSLIGGNIFPSGVYPHGFHNVVSGLAVFSGINAVTVMNYFSIISVVLIMTMLYFGLRNILNSRYAALFGFLIYSLINFYDIKSILRFQFSIPQEYGMIMLMPMAVFLFKYLKEKRIKHLTLFGICFSLTLSMHFYTAIIALILCFVIGSVYLYRIIAKRLLIKILLCGVLSTVVALAPLAVGLAMGHEMEQSMNWAIRIIQGKEDSDYNESTNGEIDAIKPAFNWSSFLEEAKDEITKYVFSDIRIMYVFLSILALTIIYCTLLIIFTKQEKKRYLFSFAIFELILIFLILCDPLNIPTIMASIRVAMFFAYFSPIFIAMPLEIVYNMSNKRVYKRICSVLTIIVIPVTLFMIIKFGFIRPLPPFYYFQTKGAMLVSCNIMEKYNDYEWTVVSPVNDISVIQNNGFHYELSDFILEQEDWHEDIKIRIPTKYVFVYIEKKPLVNYGNIFYKDDKEITDRDMVTYANAQKNLIKGLQDNAYYKAYRDVLMSKAYYWAQEYKKYFPKEMTVYYEDDEFIVYRLEQNEYVVNNLAINYGVNVAK